MLFRQFFDKESFTFTYLLGSNKQNAIIFDPVSNKIEDYLTIIKQLDVNLKYTIDTHTHADHISCSGELRNLLGCESIAGKESAVECATTHIEDNQILVLDDIKVKALYTPGHTDDSYCYLIESSIPKILLTGDTLLIRGTGRTDFQNGDSEALYNSIFEKLLTLDDCTEIYPGHDYNGFNKSTIWEERKYNPRLNFSSKQEFIDFMNNLDLPDPMMMDIAIPLNENCGIESE